MRFELGHLFVCTAPGAPEAEKLVEFGLHEGLPNRHPGQGTANRPFAFANAMIELLWVSDAHEAQSERARRTLLWERWSGREVQGLSFRDLPAPCRFPWHRTTISSMAISGDLLARSPPHVYRRRGNRGAHVGLSGFYAALSS